jgi:hypothetical protein
MGVAKNTFYKRLARERLEAIQDDEFMAALGRGAGEWFPHELAQA